MPPEQAGAWLTYLLGPFGLTVGLVALVWALVTERLVSGTAHRRVIGERNEALHLLRQATRTTRLAVKAKTLDAEGKEQDET